VPGPRLLGAYTVNRNDIDCASHYPQGYDPKKGTEYTPYTQDFLSLVPYDQNSYQTYNINVSTSVGINISSKQHLYFLSQPRFAGMEYTTGLSHLVIRDSQDSRVTGDSFRN
jgi:hypothetical protein